VIISDSNTEKLSEAKASMKCEGIELDVTNQSQIESVFTQIKTDHEGIDVLINNAGIMVEGTLEAIAQESIEKALDINLKGSVLCTREFVKQFDKGTIIMINSVSGLMTKENRSIYHATKWGLNGFTKSMQDELKGSGFRLMSVYPGLIDTNIFTNAGLDRQMENALNPTDVANLIGYMVNLPENVYLPGVEISHTSY
jgi:NADP-dependent 3-hydroxy acid dehydrogenase YdfG